MTTYTITTKTDTLNATPAAVTLNSETNIFNIVAQAADYILEGYISLQNMTTAAGDVTVVTEYIAVDGTNFEIFNQTTFTGTQTAPVLRFHGKLMELNTLYKVTVKQTAGTARSYPNSSVLQVFNA